MQRIINISDVPSDIYQKSPFRDSEYFDERYEPFVIEDLSMVSDNQTNGSRSIQFSKDFNFYELHERASSVHNARNPDHSHNNFSWAENKPLGLDNLHEAKLI